MTSVSDEVTNPYLLIGLRTLQHRGQESAGIATYDGSMMRVKKGMGLVTEAFRDPYGIRPLVLGQVDDSYIIASESCVFDVLGGKVIRDVKPGELIEITSSGFRTVFIARSPTISHCMFEYAQSR